MAVRSLGRKITQICLAGERPLLRVFGNTLSNRESALRACGTENTLSISENVLSGYRIKNTL